MVVVGKESNTLPSGVQHEEYERVDNNQNMQDPVPDPLSRN